VPVQATLAPSMDICVSSNFERLLFHLSGDNPEVLSSWMANFEKTGRLTASADLLQSAQATMRSSSCTANAVLETIKFHAGGGYVLDPHSAIGVHAAGATGAGSRAAPLQLPVVCLACAHWAKFPGAVGKAIGQTALEKLPVPPILSKLETMKTRKKVLPAGLPEVKGFITTKIAERRKLGGDSDGDGNGYNLFAGKGKGAMSASVFLGVAIATCAIVVMLGMRHKQA